MQFSSRRAARYGPAEAGHYRTRDRQREARADSEKRSCPFRVNIGERGGGRWYRSPVWIAIGAIAGVIVLLLIVLIARGGGGTTIVKE
jgi:hypothetical protein